MTSKGRLARWADARSSSDLIAYGLLAVLVGAYPYWTVRSRGFWQDPSDEFWTPIIVAAAALPLLCAAAGAVRGWRRGRGSGRAGGLAVFHGGWWFAVTAIVLTVLRAMTLAVLTLIYLSDR
ncbi:hypothetical protein [Actinoplanes sp. NPDC049316]|uniref:hypothetical protein n=1 Tax=Actinoplanes sp. NPDC049316 TaxID=3154727 RepID=UPI00342A4C26